MLNKANNKVSYAETLHPERGHKALSREEEDFPRKWGAVWAEAVLIDDELNAEQQAQESTPTSAPVGQVEKEKEACSWHKYNLFVLILGGSLLTGAVAVTFAMELAAGVIFILSAGFYFVSEKLGQIGGPAIILQSLLRMIYAILSFVDSMVLMLGTLVTEVLAFIT